MGEIELMKRNKVERLAIANTLLDSVIRECEFNLINETLYHCMESVDSCLKILSIIDD